MGSPENDTRTMFCERLSLMKQMIILTGFVVYGILLDSRPNEFHRNEANDEY